MFNKRLLIILTLLFSILVIVSSVAAEEITDGSDIIETDDLSVNQAIDEEKSLDVVDSGDGDDDSLDVVDSGDGEENSLDLVDSSDDEDLLEPIEESSTNTAICSDIPKDSQSKNVLSASASGNGNYVSIQNVATYDNKDVIVKINTNSNSGIDYSIYLYDSENYLAYDDYGYIPSGSNTLTLNLGYWEPDNYKLVFTDNNGLTCVAYIKVLRYVANAKVTATKYYSSYYKSGKTININAVNKDTNKPMQAKLKLVFKKSNGKLKTYYVTTNAKGKAKFKVNLGVGSYKLTISSANSRINFKKVYSTVKVKKGLLKITVPNYSSYYKSGKKLTVKVVNRYAKKGIAVKLKFVYKKPKAKAKVKYVTTNSKGKAKIKIPVGIGKYKLKVTPATSNYKANKVSKKVNVNKYVILKYGKYRAKIHYAKYIKLKKVYHMDENVYDYKMYYIKTNKIKTIKVPIYKTVKVKSTKWVYKDVLSSEDYWDYDYNHYNTYDYSLDKYWNNGWTWYGSYYNSYDNNRHTKYYSQFKKKVNYTETKKVKTGKYKKVKRRVYLCAESYSGKYAWLSLFYNLKGERVWFSGSKRLYL